MRLIKCPRCELNYIAPEEGYCKVCKREMKGEKQQDEIENDLSLEEMGEDEAEGDEDEEEEE